MKKELLIVLMLIISAGVFGQSSCGNALEVDLGIHDCGFIDGVSDPSVDCAGDGSDDNANWFKYTPTENIDIVITTDVFGNPAWDSRMHILVGDCAGGLFCFDGNDDYNGSLYSTVFVSALAGFDYFIVFDSQFGDDGAFFEIYEGQELEPEDELVVFEESPDVSFYSDCVVDMNGDFLDDMVSASTSNITVMYQQEDGSFEEGTIAISGAENSPSWSITAGDLDNNGYADLMYGGGNGVSIMMRSDDGESVEEYNSGEYVFSQRGNMADINMDGVLDAFMCHDVEPNVYYISDGDGGFDYFQGGLGDTPYGGNYGSVWIDYNNDCLLDLFIAKCRGGNAPENINQMHRNNGDGTYTEVGEEINLADDVQTWSSAWGDYDNDGDMDVYIGASSDSNGSHKFMRNDDGVFVDITTEVGITSGVEYGIENMCHDFNNDGYIDIDCSGNYMLINNGDMTFTYSSTAMNNGAVGDLDNDGYLDVVTFGGLYINQEEGNNYVKINTIGVESNKNGIGARVQVVSDLGSQIRDVKSGDGFGRMGSLTAHFGLGQDTEIEQIVVHWPSGNTTYVDNPDINTTHNIVEVDNGVNVEELLKENVSVFPNPTADFINFNSEINVNNFKAQILDIKGSIVFDGLIKDNRINVEELPTGTYFVRINANDSQAQYRFVKE